MGGQNSDGDKEEKEEGKGGKGYDAEHFGRHLGYGVWAPLFQPSLRVSPDEGLKEHLACSER